MATALVTVVAGLAVGAAVLAGAEPGPPSSAPCAPVEQWEADAQALADALAGVPGTDEEVLRQELAAEGFVAGGSAEPAAPEAGGWSDLLVELLVAVLGALDTNGDGEVGVTVLGPDGGVGAAPAAPDRTCPDPAAPDAPPPDAREPGATEESGPGG